MNYDDYISRDPMDGQWDRHEAVERDGRRPCGYCERGERQVPWPVEAPTMWRCQVCGETKVMRAELVRQRGAA